MMFNLKFIFIRTRMSYTYKEDAKIVEYIVKHKCAFLVAGKEMWQRMERANVR